MAKTVSPSNSSRHAPSLSWVTRRSQSGNPPASTVSPARFRFRPFPSPPAGSKKILPRYSQSPWYQFFTLNPNLTSVSSNSRKTYIGLKPFFAIFNGFPAPSVARNEMRARPRVPKFHAESESDLRFASPGPLQHRPHLPPTFDSHIRPRC